MDKITKSILLTAALALPWACNQNTMNEHKHTNALINEQSPYLLQHAHNPVDWHAWSPALLAQAKRENKLLLISIGYSTCHWCHVMERETFEDEIAADTMNALFINIKIDREERPDLDQVYMQALQLMTRQGGWPLNIIALPDGRPVWGATYLPKERWLESLSAVAKVYRESPEEVLAYAEKLQKGVQASLWVHPDEEENPLDANATLAQMLEGWQTRIDTQYGGPNRAPKFMMPENFRFLLHYGHTQKNEFWEKYVHLTLSRMLMGGIYDHVGGGFARYSTDIRWKVPHFEKMLYDNGQMLSLLADAYRESKNPHYKTAMLETLEFLHREMRAPDGGFYAALDADSEGEEGLFYVWTEEELKPLLGADYELFADFYRVGEEGFWEHGRNILLHLESPEKFTERHNLAVADFVKKQQTWKATLLAERGKRIRPGRDEKIIAGWNALAIEGLLDVWAATQLPKAKKMAEDALAAFEKFDHPDGGLWHVRTLKKNYLPAYLDDYALATSAYLKAFSVLGDDAYLSRAVQFTEFALREFSAEGSPLLLYRPLDTAEVFAASQEVEDNVIPASNSTMAQNLFLLSRIEGRMEWAEHSLAMLAAIKSQMPAYGEAYARWARVMMMHSQPFYEVAITGPKARNFAQTWQAQYHPNTVVAFSKSESDLLLFKNRASTTQTRIFVCENASCLRPVENVEEAVGMVKLEGGLK